MQTPILQGYFCTVIEGEDTYPIPFDLKDVVFAVKGLFAFDRFHGENRG
jgi:hypothetical protein